MVLGKSEIYADGMVLVLGKWAQVPHMHIFMPMAKELRNYNTF
jgi:hypothetical protein